MSDTQDLPMQSRAATFVPASYNEEDRTIDVIWSTGARVRRYDFWKDRAYYEELDMAPESVDMARLESGAAPVLDSHDSWSLRSQIGVVESAHLADGEGRATLRLSGRSDIAELVEDIKAGIIRNISVGYQVREFAVTEREGDLPIYRAVDWEPYEISFVPIPADAAAKSRSAETRTYPCTFRAAPAATLPQEAETMSNETQTTRAAETPNVEPTTPAVPEVDHVTRAADIAAVAAREGCADRAPEWIKAGMSVEQVKAAILDERATADARGPQNTRVEAGADEREKMRAAGVNSILARAMIIDPTTRQRYIADGSNPFRGRSLLEVGRQYLERAGVRTDGLSRMELAGRLFTQGTGDFTVLLEDAMHKSLLSGYHLAPITWDRWARKGSVNDFRVHTRYQTAGLGNLKTVNEFGEFQNETIPDGESASIQAATKGYIINLTRKALVNDDLGAFVGLAGELGRAAARTVEADAYTFLKSPGLAQDGNTAYQKSTGHKNKVDYAAPSVVSFSAAIGAFGAFKDLNGVPLSLAPSVFVGGLGDAADARVVNGAEYDPDTANKLQKPNKVRGTFTDIVGSGHITTSEWYALTDPNLLAAFEVAFLEGNDTPYVEQENGFTVDGTRYKVRLDYGIAMLDWRGVVQCQGS